MVYLCITKKLTKPVPDIIHHIGAGEASNEKKGRLAAPKF
jgi:hypothetical protein